MTHDSGASDRYILVSGGLAVASTDSLEEAVAASDALAETLRLPVAVMDTHDGQRFGVRIPSNVEAIEEQVESEVSDK
jgi:hypothetical protein